MTDTIEQKALALVTEVCRERGSNYGAFMDRAFAANEALCRAIERHEAFRQEVSDAVEVATKTAVWEEVERLLSPFIIAKPDPLVEAFERCGLGVTDAAKLRAAIKGVGGKITFNEE